MTPYAVVIAGGAGERLGGVRKGELRIGGQRLIDRVTGALGEVAPPLLLATGPNGRAALAGHIGVPDLTDELGGPLAGLAAAVDWLANKGITEGVLVSVAVDTPFLPQDFVARMLEAMGTDAAAYARWSEDFYPPNAAWKLSAIGTLPRRVLAGTAPKSLKLLLAELGAGSCDWHGTTPLNPFENLNNLADVVRLGRRAKQFPHLM